MTATFCREPWTGIFIGPNSDVRTCCPGEIQLGDITQQSLQDILTSDKAKSIRQEILDGKWSANCEICRVIESNGVRSYRNPKQQGLEDLLTNDPMGFRLESMDVRWRNTCQLTCRYCDPKFSSSWANVLKVNIKNDSGYYPDTLDWLKQNSLTVEKISLLGGEPLLIKENADLLKLFDNKNIVIELVTGFSVDLSKSTVWQEVEKFNQPMVSISFENTGPRFEYVRRGASWPLVRSNIKWVKENFPTFILRALPVYNLYSAVDLDNFYNFVEEVDFDVVHWNMIKWPDELNMGNFGPEIKSLASKHVNRVLDRLGNRPDWDTDFLVDVDRNLLKSYNNSIDAAQFTQWMTTQDQVLKHNLDNFFDLWPEYQPYLKIS